MSNVQLAFDYVFSCLVGLWSVMKDYWFLCIMPAAYILVLVINVIHGSIDRN